MFEAAWNLGIGGLKWFYLFWGIFSLVLSLLGVGSLVSSASFLLSLEWDLSCSPPFLDLELSLYLLLSKTPVYTILAGVPPRPVFLLRLIPEEGTLLSDFGALLFARLYLEEIISSWFCEL